MAFVKKATHTEKQFPKLSDIPRLAERCTEKDFCKSGLITVEHLVPPGRYQNFTLVSYSENVRVNVSTNNSESFDFLTDYAAMLSEDGHKAPQLMFSIRDRTKGYFDLGTDDKKTQDWSKVALGFAVKGDAPF